MLVLALVTGLLLGLCSNQSILCAMTLPAGAEEEQSSKRAETEPSSVSAVLSARARNRTLPVVEKHVGIHPDRVAGCGSQPAPGRVRVQTQHSRWHALGAPLRC